MKRVVETFQRASMRFRALSVADYGSLYATRSRNANRPLVDGYVAIRWRFGLVVASLGTSTKLLYAEPD